MRVGPRRSRRGPTVLVAAATSLRRKHRQRTDHPGMERAIVGVKPGAQTGRVEHPGAARGDKLLSSRRRVELRDGLEDRLDRCAGTTDRDDVVPLEITGRIHERDALALEDR